MIDSKGQTAVRAHVDSPCKIRVSRYGVNIDVLDSFIDSLFVFHLDELLYIDEVGQMELYSPKFCRLVEKYIASPNNFVGTITSIYNDKFVDQLKYDPRIEIITVTPENRDQLFTLLQARL